MKSIRCLGIDPGIANCGLAVVESVNCGYRLLSSRHVSSRASDRETERALNIYNHIYGLLNEFSVDGVFMESVYHNKNVSSSIKTGKAMGAALVAVGCHALPVVELTPQAVKSACGVGSADKRMVLRISSRLFGVNIKSHHIADAALCGLAGCLRLRSER